jgi:hypothetical protein
MPQLDVQVGTGQTAEYSRGDSYLSKAGTGVSVQSTAWDSRRMSRKWIEIRRFDATSESLQYGELFLRFRKRDGFLVTRSKGNMVVLKTAD